MRKQQQKHIEMENEFQAYPSVRTRKHGRRTSKWRKRGTNFVGMLFLFVTFTQIGTGGAMVFLTRYLPLMIVLLALLAALEGRFNPRASSVFLILFGVMFISNISVSSLQYIIVILAYLIIISTLQSKRLPEKITDYAFYAMILNIVIYASEVILIGGLGISFDPTIFNYIGDFLGLPLTTLNLVPSRPILAVLRYYRCWGRGNRRFFIGFQSYH
jgi:hypothetical protein